jgi:GGDEF domain-containing protein
VQLQLRDITAEVAEHAVLERFASADSLTESLNRRAWESRVEAVLDEASATGAPLTVALIDRCSVPAGQTCSIGHTTWIPGEAMTETVTRADRALYEAKNTGRDRIAEA